MNWRLLVHENASPEYNMAVDEAILECFDPSLTPPTLRLYSWSPAAVSIGYFQPAHGCVRELAVCSAGFSPLPKERAEALTTNVWRGGCGRPDYPILRRITGGGAICHDGDFTYAVVVGRSDPITRPSLYNAIHEVMSNALFHLGIEARPRWATRQEDVPVGWNGGLSAKRGLMRGEESRAGEVNEAALGTALAAAGQGRHASAPFFCSGRQADADLVVGGRKILGSAQRRSRTAILQHGSMPLDDASCDALMTSVRQESGKEVPFQDVASAVLDSFRSLFGVRFQEGEVSGRERALADRLTKEKYGSSKWNYRR